MLRREHIDLQCSAAPAADLVRLIEDRFTVAPDHSTKSFETFATLDGDELTLSHYTFVIGLFNRDVNHSERERTLAVDLWERLKRAWSPGTFLVWRLQPVVANHSRSDGEVTYMRLRIGAFVPPIEGAATAEGADVRIL
jgi:hypothetical protein